MTRVLIWKELREQRTSAIVVVLLGIALIYVAVNHSGQHGDYRVAAELAIGVAWICGLVAGVQPLATEVESGTLHWLDTLPVTRLRLWRAKCGAAAVIILLQLALLLGVVRYYRIHDSEANFWEDSLTP